MYTLLYKFRKSHTRIRLNQCQGTSKRTSSDGGSVTSSKPDKSNKTGKHSEQDSEADSDERPKKKPKKPKRTERFV